MHTPTQAQWATVIEKLYSVLPFTLQEGSGLDMGEGFVNGEHVCGTTHCLAGWYAIAHWKDKALDDKVYLDFRDGAKQLANDLGFKDRYQLMNWAEDNSAIWGNDRGRDMFHFRWAYGRGEEVATSLADIINHFEFVADNCKS